MKFSYQWIANLVPSLQAEPRELMRLITLKTAECEGVETHAPWLHSVTLARVVEVRPLEGSHNVVALIDAGPTLGPKTVVCGAPNCRAGLLTAYVPSGVRLGNREIRTARIAGVESDGMLASGAELGLNRDTAGILEFTNGQPGGSIPGVEPESLIEVDNKSLTHRPDLWGHYGMAREVAAFTAGNLKDPVRLELLPSGKPAWDLEIRDFDRCPRYSALVFENVAVGPSPLWLQARLEALGLNPISNVVDVTNYVMAELAQPMHAFDAAKLRGPKIIVRGASEGEAFHALNGETYTLEPAHLVIADEAGAVALAGVIGGMESAIGPGTNRIVLESANFQAASVRKTSSALKLRTDASMRFEKAQDPVNTTRALARAVELFNEVCPGIRLVGGVVDSWKQSPPPPPIELSMEWLIRKLGRPISASEVRRILESLEFTVTETSPDVFSVAVPTWRATRDITIKDDLLEEVGRMIGYDSVPPQAPLQPVTQAWQNPERRYHHRVRTLTSSLGYTETYNYSFLSEDEARRFHWEPAAHVRVLNPISSEQGLLRTSLLPGIYRNILENCKRFDDFRLFEIGNEIHKRANSLPDERSHLMAVRFAREDGVASLFELKHLAESLAPGCTVKPSAATPYEHPARTATLSRQGIEIGRLFELHPQLIENGRAAVLDVDLKTLMAQDTEPIRYRQLRRFPSSAFDLSVVTGLKTLVGDVKERLQAHGGDLLDHIVFLRQYTGAPLAHGQKSVSFRLTVSAADHTLSSEEVTKFRNRIIDGMQTEGFELRV